MLKITLRQWYCWADETLDLAAPCSSVVGFNGSGKSSGVRDALEFALIGTGFLRGAKTKRELAAVAIRDDAEECEVTVEAHGIRIRRTMDRDGKQEVWRSVWGGVVINGFKEAGWSNEEPMALQRDKGNPFGDAPDDLVRCMLEPTHFATLEPSRRQEILVIATSDPKVDEAAARDALVIAIEAVNPALTTLDLDRVEDADKMLDAIADTARWIAESGFRGAEDAAIERRKEAKRDRLAVVVGEMPEPMFRLPSEDEDAKGIDLEACPLSAHQDKLAKLRQDHIAAVQLESAGAGAMQGKLTEAEQALAELEAQPEPTPPVVRVTPELSTQEEPNYADLDAIRADAKEAERVASSAYQSVRNSIEALEATLAGSREFERPAACPKGPPGMRCPVKPSVWKPAVEKTLGDGKAQAAKLDRLRGEALELRDKQHAAFEVYEDAGRLRKKGQEQGQAIQRAKESVERHERLVTAENENHQVNLEIRRQAVEGRRARVAEAREAFEAAQQGEKPTGPSVADLVALIAVGEAVCEASRDYWRAREAWGRREVEAHELDTFVVRWDAIAQQLKPEGIETTLGGNAREEFAALLAVGTELAGPIHMDEDCGITVEVDREDRPRHPLQLSTSQQLAVGVAIQHALCQQLHFPILVMDAVDTFDAEKRKQWAAFSAFVAPLYPGGVVGMATIMNEPRAPAAPWQTIWLKPDGSVATLGAGDF